MADAALVRQAWAAGIRPDVQLSVSAWADAHRVLPKRSSAEPGRWRTARTPYLQAILDDLSTDSPVQTVILQKASQLGGSEVGLNFLGYIVDHSPGPTLVVQPTVDLAKRFSRQRIEPLVTATPRLRDKVAPARQRDSGNTVQSKLFPGGVLIVTGANSAVGLRSMPAQYVFLDEVDGYPLNVNDEGSPLALVEARQRTFVRRKKLIVSTPTIAGYSAIEAAYEASDRRRYYVPCPSCGEFQTLAFPQLTWTKLGLAPEQAVYTCVHCEQRIDERHKTTMLSQGEWRPTNPDHKDPTTRGYHVNALYSPMGWLSWGQIARQWTDAQRDPIRMRTVVNTVLGETWQERGEAPEWERLMRRRESYQACPRGVLFLTAGVDVQRNRLVIEVVGWGRGKTSWSVDYGEVEGDPSDLGPTGPWAQVDALLARAFAHEARVELKIKLLAVDSGYNTQAVYDWSRRHPGRVIVVKGTGSLGMIIGSPTVVDITHAGRKVRVRPVKVWPVGGDVVKMELYGFLRLELPVEGGPAPPGYCHFPEYDAEYFKQLTAEELVTRTSRVRRNAPARQEWGIIPGRENHVLDCRVYARAAAARVGMDRLTDAQWAELDRAVNGGQR